MPLLATWSLVLAVASAFVVGGIALARMSSRDSRYMDRDWIERRWVEEHRSAKP